MIRSKIMILLTLIALVSTGVDALSCRCTGECPTLSCPGGLVKDPCGCCMECAKQIGDVCGGMWEVSGKCDEGLFCHYPSHVKSHDGTATGICRELNPDCSNVTCETDIDEPCPFASTRHYRMLEPGKCCPRASECKCDDVCPPKPVCQFGHHRHFLMKKGTGRLESCCDEYECRHANFSCSDKLCILWDCPSDSMHDMDPDQGEACCPIPTERMCVCDASNRALCPVDHLKCKPGHQIYTTHRRISGTPGQCCNKEQCLAEPPKHFGCLVGNITLEHGGFFHNIKECTTSECEDGILKTLPIQCNKDDTYCDMQHEKECCAICGGRSPYDHMNYPDESTSIIAVCRDPYNDQFHAVGDKWTLVEDNNCTQCQCLEGGVWHCRAAICNHQPEIIPLPEKINHKKHPGNTNIIDEDSIKCATALSNCTLKCPRGFETDKNGCEKCICKRRKRLCRTKDTTCMKDCPYGFKKSKNCQRCKCLACPKLHCSNKCTFGYKRNEFNCPTCECDSGSLSASKVNRNHDSKSAECRDEITDELRSEGERWKRGCLNCTCGGGEIYCEIIKCAIPKCQHPIFTDGHCCPYCPGTPSTTLPAIPEALDCYTDEGNWNEEGSTWKINGGCTTCLCYQGKVTCTSTKCRPLACKITIQVEGECCRKCADETPSMRAEDLLQLAQSRNREELYCLDSNLIRRNWGEQWHEDRCTSCVCISGIKRCYTSQCESKLPCANPVLLPDECCPRCIQTSSDYHVNTCQIRNKIKTTTRRKKSDESGLVSIKLPVQPEDCDNCTCVHGKPHCEKMPCPWPKEDCPMGRWVHDQYSCCPRCERTKPVSVASTTTSTSVVEDVPDLDTDQDERSWRPAVHKDDTGVLMVEQPDELDSRGNQDSLQTRKELETNPMLVAVCTSILILLVVIVAYTLWWKRSKKASGGGSKKDTIDPYPNVKPQLVEPVSCL